MTLPYCAHVAHTVVGVQFVAMSLHVCMSSTSTHTIER